MIFAYRPQALVARAFEAAFEPPVPMPPSAWAKEHLIVPDGPKKMERWDAALTPYIAEPLDFTSTDSPVNEFCVMKSAQTGFTTMLLAAIGHTIDRDKADTMVVQPTDGALSDFNSKKLQPCLEETEPTAALVARQSARSAQGSTTYEKRFGRYAIMLALASSSADLRSKSVQKAWLDECDEYPDDLNGQGSPFDMVEARQESFLKLGTWKRGYISTPTIKGGSHIERMFERSDKRRWHVRCPQCAHEFVFTFGPAFRFSTEWPHNAFYACEGCGMPIHEGDRVAMIKAGRWIATDPHPGAMPGFHFDALSSPFVPFDKIAERCVKAGTDPAKLKTFYNLTLGLPYEFKGDAPDHEKLMLRREEGLLRGHVPARGLILVAAADVQMRGIWVEILALAPNRETWLVDAFYCDGSTESPDGEAFQQLLAKTVGRAFPDAFGRTRRLDGLAIDSGYRSHVVYAFVRRAQSMHPDTGEDLIYAVDGRDGWGKPPIGTPSLTDIDLEGHKVKKGCKLWPVGTWPLKGAFYADLRKEGLRSGAERDPDGYCHFGAWVDEGYFRQVTAEYIAEENFRGRPKKSWKVRSSERDNHYLDCRVYNLALAEHLGLSTTTPDEWVALARRRGMPDAEASLFRPAPLVPASLAPALRDADAQRDEPASTEEALDDMLDRLGRSNAELWGS